MSRIVGIQYYLKFDKGSNLKCSSAPIEEYEGYFEHDCKYAPKEGYYGVMNLGKFIFISGIGRLYGGFGDQIDLKFLDDQICSVKWNRAGKYAGGRSPEGFELDCPTKPIVIGKGDFGRVAVEDVPLSVVELLDHPDKIRDKFPLT